MDRRCREILDILLKENGPIPARRLEEAFRVTGRAVRYDLRRLDGYLIQYGLPPLVRNSLGIGLRIIPEQAERLLDLLARGGEGVCFFNQQRRTKLIELDLLLARDFVRIEDLCGKYLVSRSTVVNDLARLRRGRGGLFLIRGYPHKGFRVEADERGLRHGVISCLLDLIPQDEAVDYLWPGFGESPPGLCMSEAARHGRFSLEDLKACANVAVRLEEALSAIWSDHSILRICYALLICLLRVGQGAELASGLAQEIARTRDYAIVREVLQSRPEELGGGLTPEDVEFVTLYALGAETQNISYFRKENHIQLELCAARILKSLAQTRRGFRFSHSDDLQDKLSEFLSHSFYRIRYGLPPASLAGPAQALHKIIKALPAALTEFSEFVGLPVPYAEREALAALIHGAEVFESDARFAAFRTVVIVGGTGPERVLYLAALRANFPQIDVAAVIVRHQVPNYKLAGNLDFIITTAPLKQSDVPEFVIADMSSARETAALRKYLAANRPRHSGWADNSRILLRRVLKIAGSVCEREVYDRFAAALSARIGPVEHLYYRGDISVMLKDMLLPENIRLDVAAGDWETAVRLCGDILVNRGYVEPRFVEAMLSLVRENGPYIVIAPGLAFPHARPEDGAKIMGLSLVRLRDPVEFGNEDNDPVRLIIALSAIDSSSHIEALAELFEVIAEEENRERLMRAATPEEIISIFTEAGAAGGRKKTKQQSKEIRDETT